MANEQTTEVSVDTDELAALEPVGDAPLLPAHGIAAIALNMALKFADINTVQDGALYQQYKLEGRNIQGLHLEWVFHIADRIERRIMDTPNRLSAAIFEQIEDGLNAAEAEAGVDDGDQESSTKADSGTDK